MLCAPFGQKGSHINELPAITKQYYIEIGICVDNTMSV